MEHILLLLSSIYSPSVDCPRDMSYTERESILATANIDPEFHEVGPQDLHALSSDLTVAS